MGQKIAIDERISPAAQGDDRHTGFAQGCHVTIDDARADLEDVGKVRGSEMTSRLEPRRDAEEAVNPVHGRTVAPSSGRTEAEPGRHKGNKPEVCLAPCGADRGVASNLVAGIEGVAQAVADEGE